MRKYDLSYLLSILKSGLLAALRTNEANLTIKRLNKRENYLQHQPAIAAIYQFKQRLHRLLMKKHRTAKQCKRLIPLFLRMVDGLKESPFESLKTLGKTLYQWRDEVVRMWRFTKNNGIECPRNWERPPFHGEQKISLPTNQQNTRE